jgi:glutamate carboxypeptidase
VRNEEIVAASTVPGTVGRLEIKGEFLPLVQDEASRTLFDGYQAATRAVGLEIEGEFSGGCADSGFTSAVGCPTLCSVGPVGGKAHSPDEYLEVASLVPRAQGLALAIARLGG